MKNFIFKRFLACVFLFVLIANFSYSQKYTISGYVQDAHTGEKLYGANIYDTKNYVGTYSNEYGFYSLTLPAVDSLSIAFSFIGYETQIFNLNLNSDQKINVELSSNLLLEEFVVTDKKSEELVNKTQMSVIDLPVKSLKNIPVLMGEADVLKTIQLLPGVQSGNEGTSGIYVRGGGPDQNLFLLDGVPVYNTAHLFGMFSVFNPDALSSVKLIKGGFPAQYGGRLSSVVDVKMKEGNMKELHGEGSVGLVAAKFTLEGPIKKDKTSFLVSGRRTYIDIIALPFLAIFKNKEEFEKLRAGYNFFDANVKLNHIFNDKNRLFLSFYSGRDVAKFKLNEEYTYQDPHFVNYQDYIFTTNNENRFNLNWGNITSSLRWNHIFTNKLFSNTTLVYSNYKFNTKIGYQSQTNVMPMDTIINHEDAGFLYTSGIEDFGAKIDFDYIPHHSHLVKFGVNYLYHRFKPGVNIINVIDNKDIYEYKAGNEFVNASEFFAYVQDNWDIARFLKANIGVHYSGFLVRNKYYQSIQPRATLNFLLNKRMSIKASYASMNQYIHLLTNSTIGLPTDLWVPTTDSIKPQLAHQFALGWNYNIDDNWDISLEGFYKIMDNLLEYKEGASFMSINSGWEEKVLQGKGWSYGAEIFVRKNYGKLTGWIGYTLSWAYRQFDDINFGEKFPYRYDRRHDISIVASYKINDRINLNANWVFGTGNAVTLSSQVYEILQDNVDEDPYSTIQYYSSRNGYRMPAYHRLDFAANFSKQKSWGERIWTVGIYNVYNHLNAFVLLPVDGYNNEGEEFGLKKVTLFPIIPYFSYSFKF